jgi:hypothetical protein
MNLLNPVFWNCELIEYTDYCQTVKREQQSALEHLGHNWIVPESLKAKVFEDGTLKPFFGDTIVSTLTLETSQQIKTIQDSLYQQNGIFATKLDYRQFHVTIHDLNNGNQRKEIEDKMTESCVACRQIFTQLADYFRQYPEQAIIKLEGTNVFPCLNISLLLGLIPASDQDFRILLNVHNLFNEVVSLDYWLRPHITLAYFRPIKLSQPEIRNLSYLLAKHNPPQFQIQLDLKQLAYQIFEDMNHYQDEYLVQDAERPCRHSHAERGNEKKYYNNR